MSAELTKGSFGHFSSFYVIKILKTSKISIFCMFLQESQIASNMYHNQRRKHFDYNACCHGNSCAYGLRTSYKTGYLISNALRTRDVHMLSICAIYANAYT